MEADGFKPATAADVTDLELLPRRFEQFAAEVRTSFELLGEKILPKLERIEVAITDLAQRMGALERAQLALDARVTALEARAHKKPRKKARR